MNTSVISINEVEKAILDYQLDIAIETLSDLIEDDSDGRAMYLLALCCLYNADIDDEKEEIIEELLERGYELENPLAAIRYAKECSYEEEDIYEEYMSQIKHMSENGDVFAEYEYGDLLIQSKRDIEEGVAWLKESSKSGFWLATIQLGQCYEDGIGVETNGKKAFRCYKQAYRRGVPMAMELLGDCYYYGMGTEENEEKACEIYSEYVSVYLNNIEDDFGDDEDDIFDSLSQLAENLNKIPNMKYLGYNLGMCLLSEDDSGFLSSGYFKAAADLKNPFACYELAKIYYLMDYDEDSDSFSGLWLEDASDYLDKASKYSSEYDDDALQLGIAELYTNLTEAMLLV